MPAKSSSYRIIDATEGRLAGIAVLIPAAHAPPGTTIGMPVLTVASGSISSSASSAVSIQSL
jgi:hypothetical protein